MSFVLDLRVFSNTKLVQVHRDVPFGEGGKMNMLVFAIPFSGKYLVACQALARQTIKTEFIGLRQESVNLFEFDGACSKDISNQPTFEDWT